MMTTWYHGTTKKNYRRIKKEGLKAGTYFTPDLHSAITMGGSYVFGVVLDRDLKVSHWEWISDREFKIFHFILKFDIKLLHYNKNENRKFREEFQKEQERVFCETCGGHGEIDYPDDGHFLLPRGSAWGNREMKVCPVCKGFGGTFNT